jgi:GNAT superfamily N-acetyltransferase
LARLDRRSLELNEVGWWSHWGEARWISRDCYILTSRDLAEPFFNRACLLSCDAMEKKVRKVEESFRVAGLVPHLTFFESCRSLPRMLNKEGYTLVDTMIIQKAGAQHIPENQEVTIREAGIRDVGTWTKTYLRSFYGELSLEPEVVRIVNRLAGTKEVTLLIAELDGSTSGVTALYRTPGLLGLYCLGTLPKRRGRGVARSLLGWSQEIARDEKRHLILQSLASEETEPFYSRFGFKRLYTKDMLRGNSSPEADWVRAEVFGTVITRVPGVGVHSFTGVFRGFEKVNAVKGIFGKSVQGVLSKLPLEVVEEEGYMHINPRQGSIVASASYLKGGNETYLYLDIIHELVHIRQHIEGKELWDRRYKYVDRPTELEAYAVAVEEARRVGLTDGQIAEYLKVEWVNAEDFRRFLSNLGVRA